VLAWLVAFALAILIGFGPRWWEHRLYRETEALTGVGAPILAGSVTDARRKVDPGRAGDRIVAALGRPSMSTSAQGLSKYEVWTYYYADGTMTLNMLDGIAQRITLSYGPPLIPTSRRPR
jgi:hypothetical protein